MIPRVLIIAGSDSGGGAGIQADIKTVTMLGGHAMTAITAITAQNTLGVQAVHPVPVEMVIAQIDSVVGDIGVDAVKIGMIGSAETANAVADRLEALVGVPIVFDPVIVATSGDVLADEATIAAFGRLMRIATLVTPNLPELIALEHHLPSVRPEPVEGLLPAVGAEKNGASTGSARTEESALSISRILGVPLLVKGGHGESDEIVDRLVYPDGEVRRWTAPRIDTTSTHGTGCTLASAIATYLARGTALVPAVARARQFVRLAIRDAPGLGQGHGPMAQQSVRLDLGPGARLNQVTVAATDYVASCAFYRALGLRQIVATDDEHYARFEASGGATLWVEKGARPTVFFECEDLDAEVRRLQEAGMKFDQLPVEQDWLWREARLTDPAGNAVCLYQADENRRFPPWRLP